MGKIIDTFREFCYNPSLCERIIRAKPEVSETLLEELKKARRVVGAKQIRKLLPTGQIRKVFLAQNADPMLTEPIAALCGQYEIEVETVQTMRLLGDACKISVEAAAAALL